MPIQAQPNRICELRMRAELLPRPRHRGIYLIYAPVQAALRLLQVLWTLLVRMPAADVLLVQSPPAIPTLAAAWLVRALIGSAVVVDWHNLGFSILQFDGRTADHPLVRCQLFKIESRRCSRTQRQLACATVSLITAMPGCAALLMVVRILHHPSAALQSPPVAARPLVLP